MGIELEMQLNEAFTNGREGIISKDTARLKVFVIPTNEELLIARDTMRLVCKND
jgi:acetate kinase